MTNDDRVIAGERPLFEQQSKRLQLVFDHDRNRQLLAEWLADSYTVETPDAPTLDSDVDLCLVDDVAFARHRDALDEWKQRTDPVFAPVLLVSEDPVSERFDPADWQTIDGLYIVDDVVSVPVEKPVLHRRLVNLLERRSLSETLDSKYRRSEERFSSLFATLPDPALVTGADGTLRFANEALCELCDGDLATIVGRPLSELSCVDDDAVDTIETCIETAVAGDPLGDVEVELVDTAGDRRWAGLNANAVTVDGEQVVTVVLRDVTERKERERRLAESERKFRAVFEGTNDALLIADDDGTYVDANPAACDLLSLDKDAIVGRNIADFAADDFDFDVAWREFLRDGEMQGEFELVPETGETRIVEYRATADVTPGRHLSAHRDVTERKQMEDDLRESEQRFRQMAANLNETIWLVDATGDLLYVSPGYESLTGRTPSELEADSMAAALDDVHPADTRSVEAGFRSMCDDLAEGDCDDAYHFEYRIVDEDGSTRWVETDAYPITSADGETSRVVGITDDITERKRRQRELERQNERLEEFAGIVSHDLRNPLQVISARLDIMEPTPEQAEHVDAIGRATQRMEQLIDDLLSLARNGETVSEVESVDLATVAQRAWETVDAPGATLAVEPEAVVEADASRLRQLFENLFRNAVEHGSPDDHPLSDDAPGLTVRVGSLRNGFYVEDDGPGIPADQREQVFERGFSTRDDGTGFGLNIVAEIAAAHDWTVDVTEGTDGGARFEITGVETT